MKITSSPGECLKVLLTAGVIDIPFFYRTQAFLYNFPMLSDQQTEKIPLWQDPRKRAWLYQISALIFVVLAVWYFYSNTIANLARQNIASGFGFFKMEAGFEISESIIDYWSDDNYFKALGVGVLNTLKVAVIGNILAVILGTLMGVLGLSKNWLVAKLSQVYVEGFRNVPLLLQLFFWYALFTEIFPAVKQAYNPLTHVYVSQRGVLLPVPVENPIWKWVGLAMMLSLLISPGISWWAKRRQALTGKVFPVVKSSLAIFIVLPLLVWVIGGAPTELDVPQLNGFNFQGGYTLTPEFLSLLLGLVLYTSAFMAEIVRAGINSVRKGQWEACHALGLSGGQTMGLVILPQALRVIVPPMTSQLLNLTKNSSLAVGIGYPDFVSVANTSMNQTGQAIEMVSLIMLVYLTFSLSTSLFMNWYNKRISLVER